MMMAGAKTITSSDGITTKYRFKENGHVNEVVHVDRENKHIICFPSQIGCKMNCKFCMAGEHVRNLDRKEMIGLCNYVLSDIPHNKPILLSCMGVGEPSLNAEALLFVFRHFRNFNKDIRFAVSTLAIDYDGIMHLMNSFIRIKFLLSVHAIRSEQRRKIFGFNPPLQNTLDLLRFGGRIEINYMLIEGLNDSEKDAKALVDIAGGYMVKLNKFNPVPECDFRPSSNSEEFMKVLREQGANFETYATDGSDIKAACGQLIGGRE